MNDLHDYFMKKAIELSQTSVKNGNHPFGALLVNIKDNKLENCEIILEALNTVHSDNDVTKHAELNLISYACKKNIKYNRPLWLYTSTEPCVMCCGAIYWSGLVGHVVYGCSEQLLTEIANSNVQNENDHIAIDLPCRDVFATCHHIDNKVPIEVIGPILEVEAANVHRSYWQ